MFKRPTHCANPDCCHHHGASVDFYRKRGYFTPKSTGIRLARYQCKICGTTFSNRSFADDRNQKRPELNKPLADLLCSGVTLRRAAKLLGCSYNTVLARLPWLGEQAANAHQKALKNKSAATSYVQFDQMETFEASAAKPLTIALAVRAKTGEILSIKVGKIAANGYLATKGQALYQWTKDEGKATCAAALAEVALVAKPGATIASDGASMYPGLIAALIPTAQHDAHVGTPATGAFDPLYRLNHTCAKLRADISRLARKTWATTKDQKQLEAALNLYIAWNNKYDFIKR